MSTVGRSPRSAQDLPAGRNALEGDELLMEGDATAEGHQLRVRHHRRRPAHQHGCLRRTHAIVVHRSEGQRLQVRPAAGSYASLDWVLQ